MARTKVLRELRHLFNSSAQRAIDIHSYTGPAFDVAFEILTADTFIAGIASRILDAEKITKSHRKLLSKARVSETAWRRDDGELFDLEPYPEIATAAKGVEELRLKCRQALEQAD